MGWGMHALQINWDHPSPFLGMHNCPFFLRVYLEHLAKFLLQKIYWNATLLHDDDSIAPFHFRRAWHQCTQILTLHVLWKFHSEIIFYKNIFLLHSFKERLLYELKIQSKVENTSQNLNLHVPSQIYSSTSFKMVEVDWFF